MEKSSYLYILIFHESNVIKIGKADDIHERVKILKHFWGNVNYHESYQLFAPQKVVYKLEKLLHFFLSSYNAQIDTGEGHTELFTTEALSSAIKLIELYIDSGAIPASLNKGIPRPIQLSQKKKLPNRYRNLYPKNDRFIDSIINTAKKTAKINRLLIMLIKRNKYIQYQYDIIDGELFFRFKIKDKVNDFHNYIRELFNFYIDDFSSLVAIGIGMTLQVDDLFQFTLQLPDPLIEHPLIYYVSQQSQILLKKLPERSIALTENLPLLKVKENGEIAEYYLSA